MTGVQPRLGRLELMLSGYIGLYIHTWVSENKVVSQFSPFTICFLVYMDGTVNQREQIKGGRQRS